METIKVFWKDKFNGELVLINASDFDPAKHRREADGPWLVEATDPSSPDSTSDPDADKGKKKK
jgi:hypothetical protein